MILYKHSRRMKYIKVELAQALGLTHVDATKLTFNDVASVFDACAYVLTVLSIDANPYLVALILHYIVSKVIGVPCFLVNISNP